MSRISKACGSCKTAQYLIVPIDVFRLLEEHFNERIVALGFLKSKNMGIDWPPYSPDLNPCDSFLLGYIENKVYAGKAKSIKDLKTATQIVIECTETPTLQRMMQNFAVRFAIL